MVEAWKPLEPGDTVAVVNACMHDPKSAESVLKYEKLIADQWKYSVSGLGELANEKADRLWSGTAQERADRVWNAIFDPNNKAIFLLVGGDGANVSDEISRRSTFARTRIG